VRPKVSSWYLLSSSRSSALSPLHYIFICVNGCCRLQDKSLASTYNGPIDVVRQVVRKDGILGLYAGMEATFWRCVNPPWRCSMCGSTSHCAAEGTCGGMAVTLDPSSRSSRCFQKLRYRTITTLIPHTVGPLTAPSDSSGRTLEQFYIGICWRLCRNGP
jgi:hypothetical protein